ncbi:MAG TPA: hypothetical protein DIU15_04510 [Deltaproteobacteria bacterium]|nr:hypothetical protein [Deltaproteobacteria bacterium]
MGERALRLLLVTALALLVSCSSRSPAGLPVISIDVEGHRIRAEVAEEPEDHSRGLMYRRELGTNSGMLFVYAQPEPLSFWMKNTFVPLSIAFIDDDGTIVHIADMAPQTTVSHRSPKAVRYALEVNRGWFAERGIKAGHRTQFQHLNAD